MRRTIAGEDLNVKKIKEIAGRSCWLAMVTRGNGLVQMVVLCVLSSVIIRSLTDDGDPLVFSGIEGIKSITLISIMSDFSDGYQKCLENIRQ